MKFSLLIVFLYYNNLLFSQPKPDFDSVHTGWNSTGNAFYNQPVNGNSIPTLRVRPAMADSIGGDYWRGILHPVGHHGDFWICSLGAFTADTNLSHGDSLTGTLTSEEFTIQTDTIYFLVGGTGGRIELLIKNADSSVDVIYVVPDGIEILSRKYFDTKNCINKVAMIRIVDDRTDAHINVDDFLIEKNLVINNDTINYKFRTNFTHINSDYHNLCYLKNRDTNLPVWGFVDTHAHWMNNIAFGSELVFGRPYGNIDTALKDCSEIHGLEGLGTLLHGEKDLRFSLFPDGDKRSFGHITQGYPEFNGWPAFWNLIHQNMYVDWVKRAYMGGLRLMVCQLANNENFAEEFGSEYEDFDDNSVVEMERKYLNEMIDSFQVDSWIEIAKSSDDIKRINLENKLAIVIGVEVDRPGNFVYFNGDTVTNFRKIDQYINKIYNDGIRYLYPIHEIDNVLGGFSIYSSEIFAVGNYNAKKNHFEFSENSLYVNVIGNTKYSFRLGDEKNLQMAAISVVTGYNPPYDYEKIGRGMGHMNTLGLTEYGKYFVKKLMEKGIIIDIDHMSHKSANDFFKINTIQYPVIAGHTNFLEEQFERWETDNCPNCLMNLRNEHALTEKMIDSMRSFGGMICPTTDGDKNVKTFESLSNKVINDNPGSSKTFAQCYLYALEKMHNKGVGFGSDMNGFLTQICPRFGSYSAFSLRGDETGQYRMGSRNNLAHLQKNGVKYKGELQDCREHKFFADFPALTNDEALILQAVYSAHSLVNLYLKDDQQKMIIGFKEAIRDKININSSNAREYDYDELELAAYLVALEFEKEIKIDLSKIRWFNHINPKKVEEKIKEIYPLYQMYYNSKGKNTPMVRYKIRLSGNEVVDFDFNIDGLAHYGLLPDFMQDLKNVGITDVQLTPLFNSANDFMIMMKKCEDISNNYK